MEPFLQSALVPGTNRYLLTSARKGPSQYPTETTFYSNHYMYTGEDQASITLYHNTLCSSIQDKKNTDTQKHNNETQSYEGCVFIPPEQNCTGLWVSSVSILNKAMTGVTKPWASTEAEIHNQDKAGDKASG